MLDFGRRSNRRPVTHRFRRNLAAGYPKEFPCLWIVPLRFEVPVPKPQPEGKEAHHALERRDIGRTEGAIFSSGSGDEMIPWLKNDLMCSGDTRPWLLSVRFKGEGWIHCIESRPGCLRRTARRQRRTSGSHRPLRSRRKPHCCAILQARNDRGRAHPCRGRKNDCARCARVQVIGKYKGVSQVLPNGAKALDGFFAEFDARPRDLVVMEAKGGLRLMASDGKAARAAAEGLTRWTC